VASIEYAGDNPSELIELNERADLNSVKQISVEKEYMPVELAPTEKVDTMLFKGFKFENQPSNISGATKIVYSDENIDLTVPFYNDVHSSDSVSAPEAYLIPQEWNLIVDRLLLHGVVVDTLKEEREFNVTKFKFSDVKFAQKPYEGRHRVNFKFETFKEKVKAPAGTFFIPTNQRTVRVILHSLEPKSDDSFLKWGFFNSIFEQKEYFESYVMEKVAEEMLANNPEIKKEFEQKLAEDKSFRESPDARLNFFYERSPYMDEKLNVYPVMKVE